jgi:hypothetical protein
MKIAVVVSLVGLFASLIALRVQAQTKAELLQMQSVYSAPLQVGAAGFNRLMIPAQALIQSRSEALHDIRIVDAQGQIMPTAKVPIPALAHAEAKQRTYALPVFPILAHDSASSADTDTVLRFRNRDGKQSVHVETTGTRPAAPASVTRTIGVILDTREIKLPLRALKFDMDLPNGQPVPLQIRASSDLSHWRVIKDNAAVYRINASPGSVQVLEQTTIELNKVILQGEYLQVTWPNELTHSSANNGQATVAIKAALVTTETQELAEEPLLQIPLKVIAGTKVGQFTVLVPFANHVHSIQVLPSQSNTLVPFTLSALDRPGLVFARAVAFRLQKDQGESLSLPIAVNWTGSPELTIDSDNPAIQFLQAPTVIAQVKPVEIAFLANGSGPFSLQVAIAKDKTAASSMLPVSFLIPNYESGQEKRFPQALVLENQARLIEVPTSFTPATARQAQTAKRYVLWAVLLLAVALLASLAFHLKRQNRTPPPS